MAGQKPAVGPGTGASGTGASGTGASEAGTSEAGASAGGQARLPLSALLSQALVAFTIEFDNEAEHQMAHKTTSHGQSGGEAGRGGPWLVSLVMWENCLRHLPSDGITVAGLLEAAGTPTNLDGMRRWGYLRIDPPPPRKPGPKSVLSPTPAAVVAQQLWHPVMADIEARWRARFGAGSVDGLRAALRGVAAQLPGTLPSCLPILSHGLYTRGRGPGDDQFPGLQFTEAEPAAPTAGVSGAAAEADPAGVAGAAAEAHATGMTQAAAEAEAADTTGAATEAHAAGMAGRVAAAHAAGMTGRVAEAEAADVSRAAAEAEAVAEGGGSAGSGSGHAGGSGSGGPADHELPLPTLLSRVLLTFAVEFERETPTSLAISANVLRVLGDGWTPARDLPGLAGISKEAVSMATGFLTRNGLAETGPLPPPGRGKRIRLTPAGRKARDRYAPLTSAIEDRWRARWGEDLVSELRCQLERLVIPAPANPGNPGSPALTNPGSPADPARANRPAGAGRSAGRGQSAGPGWPSLMQGTEPYPDGWRAQVRRPSILPHFPMVLHRGGYPDGS